MYGALLSLQECSGMNEIETNSTFDNLEIIDMNNPHWREELAYKIKGEVDFENLEDIKTRGLVPLVTILKLAKDMGCKCMILEDDYVDEDYLAEYSSFYSKVFTPHGSKTQRLHFFDDSLTYKDLKDLSKKNYLGFTVVRPTACYRTSRTILRPPPAKNGETYLLCQSEFNPNLSGSKLTVRASPFIQQDSNVGVCAEAAMWMCCLYMHREYGFPRFRLPTITEFATRYFMIGPPRAGLNIYQILAAFRALGYNPLSFSSSPELLDETVQAIYSYVESKIPVILLMSTPYGGHAVTAVGHDYHVDANISSKSNIDMIDCFYIQDDALGPYRKVTKRSCHNKSGDYSVLKNVEAGVVPLPPEIVLCVDDITDLFSRLITEGSINRLFVHFKDKQEYKFSERELDSLIFRTYIRRSNDFKNSLSQEMSELFRLKYRAMRMPKYLWVIELTTKKDIKSGRIVGHIIFDSTADRHVDFESFLAINLWGRLLTRKPGFPLSSCELYYDPEKPHYSQLKRPPNI